MKGYDKGKLHNFSQNYTNNPMKGYGKGKLYNFS